MGKGLTRSHQNAPKEALPIIKERYTFEGKQATITDPGAAAGWGTVVLGGLPQGNILFHGAIVYMDLTKGDSNIVAAWDGDFSIGTAPTADNTLSGSEVDIIASTATVTAASGVSSGNRGASSGTEHGVIFDNTDGSLELNLNLLVDDADISADSDITAKGTLQLVYTLLGDD